MKIRKKQKINHGRKNKRKQKICHGLTRKEVTAFRAGSVSDGINIRFGKGPFGKLRDRDFFTVSDLAELPVNVRCREIFAVCLHLP